MRKEKKKSGDFNLLEIAQQPKWWSQGWYQFSWFLFIFFAFSCFPAKTEMVTPVTCCCLSWGPHGCWALFSKTLVIWLDWGQVGYVEWPTASGSASSVGRITVALHFLFVWVNTSVSIKHVSFSWGISLRWKLAVPCSVSKLLPAPRGTPRLPGQQKAAFSTEKAPLWKTACPDYFCGFPGYSMARGCCPPFLKEVYSPYLENSFCTIVFLLYSSLVI